MPFSDVIQVLMERFNAFQNLWSLYITVVVGVFAYLAATPRTSSSPIVRLLLFAGFIGFAYVNLAALTGVLDQRRDLVELAVEQLETDSTQAMPEAEKGRWRQILEKARPVPTWKLRAFHYAVDGMVLVAIWLLPTFLVRLGPIFRFRDKEVCPVKSSLPAAKVSWNQANEEWHLAEDYEVEAGGFVYRIPSGFAFDLASVPKWLWSVIAPFELSIVAPLMHDFVYRYNGRMPPDTVHTAHSGETVDAITRQQADSAFLELMEREGVPYLRRTLAYYAVHVFGASAFVSNARSSLSG